jgi:hypothetical protein
MTLARRTALAAVRRAAILLAVLTPTVVRPADPQFAWAWRQPSAGIDIEDLVVDDFDGDGVPETVLVDPSGWTTLEPTTSGYQVERVGPHLPTLGFAVELAAADVVGDCRPELLVANPLDDRIEVWDVRESAPVAVFPYPGATVFDLIAGDLDGDGSPEIGMLRLEAESEVVLDIVDVQSGISERSMTLSSAAELALAQLDADAAFELVLTTYEGTASARDAASLAEDWAHTGSFAGERVAVGDFDDDGFDEIASLDGAEEWLTVFDNGDLVDGILWQLENTESIDPRLGAADLDGDGQEELLLSAVSGGRRIVVRSGSDGSVSGSFVTPFSRPQAITVADADGDGELEIVWRLRERGGCEEPWLGYQNATTLALEDAFFPGSLGPTVAGRQIDAAGRPEIVAALICGPAETGLQRAVLLDGGTGAFSRHVDLADAEASAGIDGLDAGQLDADPPLELVHTYASPSSRVAAFDPLSGSSNWNVAVSGAVRVRTAEVAGVVRILVLRPISEVFDLRSASTGALIWTSELPPSLGLHPEDLLVGNVDADAESEIVAFGSQGIVIYAATGAVEREIALTGVASVALLDVDGDADLDLVASGTNSLLRVVDPKTGAVGPQLDVFDPQYDITHVAAAKGLRNATAPEVALAHDGRIHLVDLSLPEVVWSSAELVPVESLAVTDADGDGQLEIVAAGEGRISVYSTPSGLIYADGFERGHLGGWGANSAAPACP